MKYLAKKFKVRFDHEQTDTLRVNLCVCNLSKSRNENINKGKFGLRIKRKASLSL